MKRTFILISLLMLIPILARAQTTLVTATVVDPNNNAYANGTASAIVQVPAGAPTSPPVNVSTNNLGAFSMNLPAGSYTFTVCASPTLLGQPTTNPTPVQVCLQSGPISISGGALDISTQLNTVAKVLGPKIVTGGAGGLNLQTQVNSGGNIAGTPCQVYASVVSGPISVNCDWHSLGPNPYVDITQFGARAGNPNTTPAATGLTANCTATQVTCTISSASTFVNGDGVIIYGAGAPHSMSTPAVPTITPSLALYGTGTLLDTPGPAGATTYNYKVVARDRNGGLTAASAAGTTTTGAASLGAITVNITSMSRSGQTVTVTTAAPHGFLVGCSTLTCGEVYIGNTNGLSDITFDGWFSVSSATDATHFTVIGPSSTALGASTTATGGTATFYNCNLVSWSAVTGAVQYYIYSDRANPGTFALIGVSNPNSTAVTPDLSWEDFGSPMESNQTFPAFVPSTAPASATSDHLSTTIASGAGTTTLTLANAAGTTVAGATIRLDAAPAILAAQTFAATTHAAMYIPVDPSGFPFVVNSWLQVNGSSSPIAQSGALYLNDTVEMTAVGNGGAKWLGDVIPQRGSGPGVDAWSSLPTISINSAHPGIYFSGSQQALHMGFVQLNSVPVNGSLGVLVDSGFNQTFDWIDCIPGGGANDYMSQCFRLRPNGNSASSNVTFDYVGMSPGGVGDGVSHTPTIYCVYCGNVIIPHSYSVHRGMLINAPVQMGVGGVAYINGGGTPLLTQGIPPIGGHNTGSGATIGTVVLDTIAHPCVADLGTPFTAGITFLSGSCSPSSNVLPVSGNPLAITGLNGGTTFVNATGGVSSSNPAAGQNLTYTQNAYEAISPIHSSFINNLPMAAPTCSVSAGGSLSLASYQFFIVPVWQNGLDGQGSFPSPVCTTTTGNQTITINWATISGNPKGYNLYYCFAPCGLAVGGSTSSNTFSNPQSPTSTSLVWSSHSFNAAVSPGITRGGPTMMMDGTKGIATPALTLAGSPYGGVYNTTSASVAANIGATTMVTAGVNGNTYRFTFYVDQTVLGASCAGTTTVQVNLNFTDPNGGGIQSYSTTLNLAVNNGVVGQGAAFSTGQSSYNIRAKASTVVTYSTTYTAAGGCSPGPSYQVYPLLEIVN